MLISSTKKLFFYWRILNLDFLTYLFIYYNNTHLIRELFCNYLMQVELMGEIMNAKKKYIEPSSMKKAFTCFHCDSLEKQKSAGVVKIGEHKYIEVIACDACSELSI